MMPSLDGFGLVPEPGSTEELETFRRLQEQFAASYETLFADSKMPRTVVVVPSMSLEAEELLKIPGVHHYEERMLCLLLLLRMPTTNLVYVSSQPVRPTVIDYYLHLLPGVPAAHAADRLTLLDCADTSITPLSHKILQRPRLMNRIRRAISSPDAAHMTCFNTTNLERTLAVQLGIPMYNTDPELVHFGSKSGARTLFKSLGVPTPDGFEDLRSEADVADAIAEMKGKDPMLRRVVLKLNEGFSGEGNAILEVGDTTDIAETLKTKLEFEAVGEHYENFMRKVASGGGVVEVFIEGETKASPSVQYRIDPLGRPTELSTHDQMLGGRAGQVYLGCNFPAHPDYRRDIQEIASSVATGLAETGVVGRFGVDFVSVPSDKGWDHYAIEINLRKGGTTLPNLMLQFLADGDYHPETGMYTNDSGDPRFYVASDTLEKPAYKGLTPSDLMDIAVYNGIQFDAARQKGVFFHLMGALSEFGKLGMMAIAESPNAAADLYDKTIAILDAETAR